MKAKLDWATDSIEKKRSGFEIVAGEQVTVWDNELNISGDDALKGNTRPHPEHDG